MGTLVAYSALGATKISLAIPPEHRRGPDKKTGKQTLVVRRFDIAAGTLDETLAAFTKITAIQISFSEDGIRSLQSAGVNGLYIPEQALQILLSGTGATYRFASAEEVSILLSSVSTAVEVKADAPEMLASSKYTELLRETPQTINVVSQELMAEQGATTLRDALRNVAGISLAAGEGGAQGDNLTIRGFTARNDIFNDGMRDFGSYYRDPFNTEELSVLKGPSSSTFGRGTTGGALNQSTKSARDGHFFNGSLMGGTDKTRRVTADFNQPLSLLGSGAAFRLNLMGNDSGVA